jgi:hypothetical protein
MALGLVFAGSHDLLLDLAEAEALRVRAVKSLVVVTIALDVAIAR